MTMTTPARCSQCGAAFVCGRNDPRGCWCTRLPALDAAQLDPAASCLCEQCLAARIWRAQGEGAA